jgi:hypothetical protein
VVYYPKGEKMGESSSSSSSGIGFLGLLTVLFIGLKLTNYIDWSWWWVLAPIWGPAVFTLGVLCIGGLGYLVYKWLAD